MDMKQWAIVGASGALSLGVAATGAVSAANAMPIVSNAISSGFTSNEAESTPLAEIEEGKISVPGSVATVNSSTEAEVDDDLASPEATDNPSAPSAAETDSPATPPSPVSAPSPVSPASPASIPSPVSPVTPPSVDTPEEDEVDDSPEDSDES